MKKIILMNLWLLLIIIGCVSITDDANKQIIENTVTDTNKQIIEDTAISDPNYLHSTSLFQITEVANINKFYPGYIISINEQFLPDEFKEIKFKKTARHEFDPSSNGIYIHDSVGAGNYGSYDFLIIYQDLNSEYEIKTLMPIPLTIIEQHDNYALYSYDGYYSDLKNNHYSGKIITFEHNNKKAFVLLGKLNFITSTEYKLKDYYNLP